MRHIHIASDIVPIGVFKAQASRLLERLGVTHRPLVITQNGHPAGVVLSPAEFDRLRERLELLSAVTKGIEQADAGQLLTVDEVRERIDEHRKQRDGA